MTTEDLAVLERATRGLRYCTAAAREDPEGGLLIRLGGYLDGEAANTVLPPLVALIKAWRGQPRVVLDMAELEYISSLGIGALTTARAVAQQKGFAFGLENLQPSVLRVFELLGVTTYMSIQRRLGET